MGNRRVLHSALVSTILLGGALLAPGCTDEGENLSSTTTATSSNASSSSATGTGGAGGAGGVGTGGGGTGGMGGGTPDKLFVGVGKAKFTPTIVESEWQDANNDGYFDPMSETFTDTNGNNQFDATWMAGFGAGRPATGVNDDLEARAIAFKKGDTTVVICILDAVGYFIDEMDLIRADPKVKALGIDHVIIGSTHVHEGVDTVGLWGPMDGVSGYNDTFEKSTRDAAAQAIEDAVKSLTAARMRIAQVETKDPVTNTTMMYVNDVRDPVIYDPTLTIAQFQDDEDPTKTIASLVNWSAHPEYAGSENHLLSADYVHWLRDTVEQGSPAKGVPGIGGTMVFVQGALGGQVGPGGGVGPIGPDGTPIKTYSLPRSQAVGTNVALLALSALKSGEDAASSDIVYREKEIFAQVDNLGYHLLASLNVFHRDFYMYDKTKPIGPDNIPFARSQVSYLQIGPLAMITAPGELHPELWIGGYDGSHSYGKPILTETENAPDLTKAPAPPYLKDLMLGNPGVKYPFVAGLTQDFLGYIVASFNFVVDADNPYFVEAAGDHYEETNSIGPKCEEHLQHPMMDLAKAP